MQLEAHQATNIARICDQLATALPEPGERTARDWAGFFAGLAALLSALLPIIIPLFAEPKKE